MKEQTCLICDRIRLIRKNENPYFVRELETGYVVIGDHQFFRGYTLFLSKIHARELHDLKPDFRKNFLWEMSLTAEAMNLAFHPNKINYELLGNSDEHLHWHLFPRYADDIAPRQTVWSIDKNLRTDESTRPSPEALLALKEAINEAFHKLGQ